MPLLPRLFAHLPPPPIVLVCHGLFLKPVVMAPLAARLHRAGFQPVLFTHATTNEPLEQAADRLWSARENLAVQHPGRSIHLLGHSLGGLLVFCAAARAETRNAPDSAPGRVLAIGSPLRGALAARVLAAVPGGAKVLGAAGGALLPIDPIPVPRRHPTGSLAALAAWGPLTIARHLPRRLRPAPLRATPPDGASDGTVLVEETKAPGLSDHAVVRGCTHAGLLVHAQAAAAAVHFLRTGTFGA